MIFKRNREFIWFFYHLVLQFVHLYLIANLCVLKLRVYMTTYRSFVCRLFSSSFCVFQIHLRVSKLESISKCGTNFMFLLLQQSMHSRFKKKSNIRKKTDSWSKTRIWRLYIQYNWIRTRNYGSTLKCLANKTRTWS